jgi:hypothetical protein
MGYASGMPFASAPEPAPARGPPMPVPTRRVGLIIWSALLAGAGTFFVVATVVGPVSPEGRPRQELAEILVPLGVGLSLVTLVLSRIVPRFAKAPAGTPAGGVALTRTIIAAALNEGAALFATIIWLLTAASLALVPFAVSVAGLLAAFPSAARWERLGGTPGGPERSRLVR